ncbi:hypothetical protein D3C87_1947660 [compost metagenome]
MKMQKIIVVLAFLIFISVTSCNSDKTREGAADSLVTDTSFMDTLDVDSVNQVDSAVRSNTMADTAGSVLPVP